MNKTIKKIVALSMGATMLAGTAAMALATSLSDYPAPFVKDGAYVGKIVIGEKAASIDTVGALDIAASLQRAASVAVSSGASGPSASAADGYLFKENKKLLLGADLKSVGISVLDKTNLPLLEDGTVSADSGKNYDYSQEIHVNAATGVTSADITVDSDLNDLYDSKPPVVFFDLTSGKQAYQTFVDFTDTLDMDSLTNSETIDLFGTTYTFASDNSGNTLTLYGSGTSLFVQKGTPQKITYQGKEYTIEVLGGNTGASEANVRINGEVATVQQGDSKVLPKKGLPFYVKQVFVDDSIAAGADISVQLFVGSNKLELNQATGNVKLNDNDLDEVTVAVDGNWSEVNTLTFTVVPSNGNDAAEIKYILPGASYTDPLFGSFKLDFVGAKDLTAGKELTTFDVSGKKQSVTFTAEGASSPVKLTMYENTAVQEDIWTGATLANMTRDAIFIYNGGTATAKKTHVLQIKSISVGNDTTDTDFEVKVDDLSYGKTYTMTSGTKAMDSDIALYAIDGTGGQTKSKVTFATTSGGTAGATYNDFALYANNGNKIQLVYNFNNTGWADLTSGSRLSGLGVAPFSSPGVNGGANLTVNKWNITEDYKSDAKDSTPVDFSVSALWDTTDDKYNMAAVGANLGSAIGNDDNIDYYLTEWGTYVVADTDTQNYVKVWSPDMEVGYDMFLLPVDSSVTVTSAATGGAVSLNPISVGMAILDSEATLGSKPYIVVGGPCANTVAAALLGNKANCAEGFTEGKAVIKLFADQNALLVAGYSGKDTQGACRVLATYKDYAAKFTGTELEVSTANLASLSVSNVQ